jgi:hypothetical protein
MVCSEDLRGLPPHRESDEWRVIVDQDKPKEAEKPKEVEPAPEEKKEDGGGGWSWGALAAMEGSIGNINNDIYGEVLTDGCALMMLDL